MEGILRDIKWALRGVRKNPGFAVATVVTLALGIGANSAVFSVVNGILIKPLPFPDADELVVFHHSATGIGLPRLLLTEADYLNFATTLRTPTDIAITTSQDVDVSGDSGLPERVSASTVTASLFSLLGVPPHLGRSLQEGDNALSATPVAVISHDLWSRRYGSDPALLGRTVILDGVSREIVGVMPKAFGYPDERTDVWLPAIIERGGPLTGHIFTGIARVPVDRGPDEVRADFQAGIDNLPEFRPDVFSPALMERGQFTPVMQPLRETLVGDVRASLWILLGTVGFVLLIACANVANLFLVRAEGGQQARAVREALGASHLDQMRLFLAESGVLAVAGGVLGLFLGMVTLGFLTKLAPGTLPRLEEVGLDLNVILFTVGLTVLAALLFGLIPMLRRDGLTSILGEGARSLTGTPWRQRLRGALVVGQVAIALTLLVGAGLMVRSFSSLRSVDPGFDADGVFTARLSLPEEKYPTEASVAVFYDQLLEEVAGLPGVEMAGAASRVPLGPEAIESYGFRLEDYVPAPGEPPTRTSAKVVTHGYFDVMGIRLVEGRLIDRDDSEAVTNAIVINTVMAERFWAGQSPLGRRIRHGGQGDWLTVVGVVGAVSDRSLSDPPESLAYLPMIDSPGAITDLARGMTLVIRTAGNPTALAGPLTQLVRAMDDRLPLGDPRSLQGIVDASLARMSFTLTVLGIAAGMALLLGAVGLYGVIAYLVSQRTREIGVRIALGAGQAQVRWMVLRNGMVLAMTGLAIGLMGGAWASRLLEAFLFEVEPGDPLTYAGVSLLLMVVAFVACYVPARRASRVDPLVAIRAD